MKCPNNCGSMIKKDPMDPNDNLVKDYIGWHCKKCDIIYSDDLLVEIMKQEALMKCPKCKGNTKKVVFNPDDDLMKHWDGWFCENCDHTYTTNALLSLTSEYLRNSSKEDLEDD